MVTTWLPSGASEGSWTVGMQTSMCGSSAGRPACASACAASISARLEFTSMIPRVVGLRPGAVDAARHRELVDGEVDLHARALAAVGADRGGEVGGQLAVAEQPEEGVLGVGVGEHGGGADLAAVLERDADGAPALDEDALDRSLGPDLGAGLARGVGHGLGHAADAAAHEAPGADAAVARLRGVVVEQDVGGAGGGGAGERVVDGVPAERALHVLGLEPLVQELGGRGGEEPERVDDRAAAPRRRPAELRQARPDRPRAAGAGRAGWCRSAA